VIKAKQFRSILFLILKLGVLGAVAFLLFKKISTFPRGIELPANINIGLALLFIGFMPLNWFIEWLKWKAIVASKNIDSAIRWHSFLSGIVSGVVTPAYAGNFIGRMFYFDKEDRKEIIVNTLVSNGSQFMISITLGIGSFALLYSADISRLENVLITSILCIGFGLYFFGDTILSKIPLKFFRTLDLVLVSKTLRTKLLGLSFLRYLTFIVQFFIALLVFGVRFDLQLFLWIALMYGAITSAPSLFFGKIIVRETIALSILALAGIAGPIILLAAFSTWLINQILPVVLATLLLKKRQKHVLV
jgi:hypothetical protein